MLVDEICDFVLPSAAGRAVADVRVGLGYTAVQLDDGSCGLAATLRYDAPEGCCALPAAGTLAGRQASELAAWARSRESLAVAVGLATMNALTPPPPAAVETGLLALLEIAADDVVGMVGAFGPLIEPIRARCRALHVFERRPGAAPGLLPESEAPAILPLCAVAIVSATTLLNGTLDGLLGHCRHARQIAIVGPSTPLLPRVFAGRGVTMLSGVHVVDTARLLRTVSEGGGTRQFGSAVRKLSVRCG